MIIQLSLTALFVHKCSLSSEYTVSIKTVQIVSGQRFLAVGTVVHMWSSKMAAQQQCALRENRYARRTRSYLHCINLNQFLPHYLLSGDHEA